jgi:hypothetical protein
MAALQIKHTGVASYWVDYITSSYVRKCMKANWNFQNMTCEILNPRDNSHIQMLGSTCEDPGFLSQTELISGCIFF